LKSNERGERDLSKPRKKAEKGGTPALEECVLDPKKGKGRAAKGRGEGGGVWWR